MQFKKDYTYNNIVEVAKKIFLRDGFAKTSMRDIAKGAGIGVSNIYNYFESKDELFKHIVAPLIAELEKMMNEHHNMKSYDQFIAYARGDSDEVININVQDYMRLLNNFRDELKLILYKAQGSSLETFMDEVICISYTMIALHLRDSPMHLITSSQHISPGLTDKLRRIILSRPRPLRVFDRYL